ncbi:MAG TPA: PIN domain-containing protein [Tepidiformaceae bacterium]|nr:PIN domain-containing protein [Tepidiformaceae bacterium]
MFVVDVNVLVLALFEELDGNQAAVEWLEDHAWGSELVGFPELVMSAYVRVVTNRRVFKAAVSPEVALEQLDRYLTSTRVIRLREGPRHWDLFRSVVLASGVAGPDVSDAYLAAFAIENNATFVTFDRGFRRFEGLKTLVLD